MCFHFKVESNRGDIHLYFKVKFILHLKLVKFWRDKGFLPSLKRGGWELCSSSHFNFKIYNLSFFSCGINPSFVHIGITKMALISLPQMGGLGFREKPVLIHKHHFVFKNVIDKPRYQKIIKLSKLKLPLSYQLLRVHTLILINLSDLFICCPINVSYKIIEAVIQSIIFESRVTCVFPMILTQHKDTHNKYSGPI